MAQTVYEYINTFMRETLSFNLLCKSIFFIHQPLNDDTLLLIKSLWFLIK